MIESLRQKTIQEISLNLFAKTLHPPKMHRIEMPGDSFIFKADAPISVASMLYAWFYYSLMNQVANESKGIVMETKPFYLSKTFWTNILGAAWFFIGPAVGIPTLDGETMVMVLGVLNVIIRLVTKQPVSIS